VNPASQTASAALDPIQWHHGAGECEAPSAISNPPRNEGKPTSPAGNPNRRRRPTHRLISQPTISSHRPHGACSSTAAPGDTCLLERGRFTRQCVRPRPETGSGDGQWFWWPIGNSNDQCLRGDRGPCGTRAMGPDVLGLEVGEVGDDVIGCHAVGASTSVGHARRSDELHARFAAVPASHPAPSRIWSGRISAGCLASAGPPRSVRHRQLEGVPDQGRREFAADQSAPSWCRSALADGRGRRPEGGWWP
jgi:hypothetical protein